MTDETAFAATFGWIEYYAAPELEGSGTLFLITLYVYKFRGKIFIEKSIFILMRFIFQANLYFFNLQQFIFFSVN